jgi:hypothetical protein
MARLHHLRVMVGNRGNSFTGARQGRREQHRHCHKEREEIL